MSQVATPPRRLRVLTLARDAGSAYGGAEKLAYEFARRLDPTRFRSYLVTTRKPPPGRAEASRRDYSELSLRGVQRLDLGRERTASWMPYGRLLSLLARERIDIVHAHMPRASIPGSVLGRLAGVPVIISHEHGSLLTRKTKLPRRVMDRAIVSTLSDLIVAVSEYDRENIARWEWIPREQIRVLHNGIDSPAGERRDLRSEFGIPAGVPLIGAVNRLEPQKGFEFLVEAAALLARRGLDFRLVIAGRGSEQEMLERMIAERALGEKVKLVGFRTDPHDVMASLDVAVLSSRWEGHPLSVAEYMSEACPIVATRVGGVPELIDDNVHGLLVPPEDPRALADSIERLVNDRPLALRLGEAARARQQREFELSGLIERLESLYLEAWAARAAGKGHRGVAVTA